MKLNKDEFLKLFDEHFNASYAETGRKLNVAPAQVYRIINDEGLAGAKFFGKLISYCDKNKLDFRKYIFLPKLLTTVKKGG